MPQPLKHHIQLLVNVVGRDGNLLLNVGPRPDGQIDPPQAERLREIGAWLRRYGESIYATRGGPFLPGDYGVSTHRDRTIYVHVLKWPEGKLLLPAIPAKIVRASVLTGGEVSLTQTDSGIELFVPLAARKEIDTIIQSNQETGWYYSYYWEWIEPTQFKDIKHLANGGFSSVYTATWIDGPRDIDYRSGIRTRRSNTVVVLKVANVPNDDWTGNNNSNNNVTAEFLNEVGG